MLAYLQLLRLPTVFTAMADILLGFVLTHRFIYGPFLAPEGGPVHLNVGWHEPEKLLGLLAASSGLYLSGMVFNDVFDVQQDTIERPDRPIPSGRISRQNATIFALILMLGGLACAALVGPVSLQVGLLLIVAILSYDAYLKRTPLGPIAMGSCRFLNVLLGASVQPDWIPSLLSQPQLAAAAGLGLYIAGVTLFAKTEARTSNRWQLALAQLIINSGFAVHVALILTSAHQVPIEVPLAMLFVVAFTINRRATAAVRDPSPARVQGSIKVMLLSLVIIDSTLVFWFLNTPEGAGYGAAHAVATAILVIPAMLLSRLIPMT
ncbi:UbiA family prenyltransferase [Schlesneria paludicola]|uniref:UbiA family prenyltransferase n=1 Tax=Schlesneria paludicola TaxID=360056 RepID=UPI000311CE09|nr:UbiA family prenyltransferase [Schlesneria paludicola]